MLTFLVSALLVNIFDSLAIGVLSHVFNVNVQSFNTVASGDQSLCDSSAGEAKNKETELKELQIPEEEVIN